MKWPQMSALALVLVLVTTSAVATDEVLEPPPTGGTGVPDLTGAGHAPGLGAPTAQPQPTPACGANESPQLCAARKMREMASEARQFLAKDITELTQLSKREDSLVEAKRVLEERRQSIEESKTAAQKEIERRNRDLQRAQEDLNKAKQQAEQDAQQDAKNAAAGGAGGGAGGGGGGGGNQGPGGPPELMKLGQTPEFQLPQQPQDVDPGLSAGEPTPSRGIGSPTDFSSSPFSLPELAKNATTPSAQSFSPGNIASGRSPLSLTGNKNTLSPIANAAGGAAADAAAAAAPGGGGTGFPGGGGAASSKGGEAASGDPFATVGVVDDAETPSGIKVRDAGYAGGGSGAAGDGATTEEVVNSLSKNAAEAAAGGGGGFAGANGSYLTALSAQVAEARKEDIKSQSSLMGYVGWTGKICADASKRALIGVCATGTANWAKVPSSTTVVAAKDTKPNPYSRDSRERAGILEAVAGK